MGQLEKPLLLLGGIPLVAHIAQRLREICSRVIVSANHSHSEYAQWADLVVPDIVPGLGPLGGLVSALQDVDTELFMCCPGDAPFISKDVVQRLLEVQSNGSSSLYFPHDGQRSQHLFLLGRTKVMDQLQSYLRSDRRSVGGFVETAQATAVPMPDLASAFRNINTIQDYRAAEQGRAARNISNE